MDTAAVLDRLIALEGEVTYRQPPVNGRPPFRHEPGRLPVLLSAPHGAAHRRNGRYKAEDEYTAALVRLVAHLSGAQALYADALSESDPNWDVDAPYKDTLRRVVAGHGVRFVIDLHGMGDRHKFGIAVGTMGGASCSAPHEGLIVASLIEHGFAPTTAPAARDFPALRWDRFVVNHGRFTGGLTSHTVTRFAAETLGIHAAQIELCATLRVARRLSTDKWPDDFRGDPAGIARAVGALARLVEALAEQAD